MDFKQALLDRTTKKPRATPKVTPEVKPDKKVKETAVMTMGRFNPPQVGHQQLIKKTEDVAAEHGGSAHILASHSEGNLRNPIPQKAKLKLLSKMVQPSTELRGTSSQEPTLLHAASKLHGQGVKHLKIVAGSDRVKEYQTLLDKYNDGKKYPHGSYKFKSIEVVSAGQRDPDSEGVKGMSGTKMRELARTGQMDKFKTGLPVELHDKAEEIAGHIRAIHEDFENPYRFNDASPEGTEYMKKMTPGQKIECVTGVWSEKLGTCVSVREAYIQNEIFKLNDVVEAMNGDKGPIVFRGSSYVTIQIKEGRTSKHWIKDIKESSKTTPAIIIKPARKIMEKQIPVLFLPKKKLEQNLNNETDNSKEVQSTEAKDTITMSNLRKRIAEMHTANRDINLKPDKEVYHGIDKTIEDQGYPGKPLGLVSFKTFVATPETQKIEQDKDEAMQDVHRAKTELATYSSSLYKMMKKYHQSDLP